MYTALFRVFSGAVILTKYTINHSADYFKAMCSGKTTEYHSLELNIAPLLLSSDSLVLDDIMRMSYGTRDILSAYGQRYLYVHYAKDAPAEGRE